MSGASWCRGLFAALLLASCANIVGIQDAALDESGSGGAGAQGSGGAGGADDPHALLCARYCSEVMKNCSGDVQVYESLPVCLKVCQALPSGKNGERSGNSVNCRLSHAEQAGVLVGEKASECPAAGPGGNGVCGENCEGFCTLMAAICPANLSVECGATCPSIEDLGGYTSLQTSGKTLQCRLYHVSAATIDAVFHCPHAAGAGPCAQ